MTTAIGIKKPFQSFSAFWLCCNAPLIPGPHQKSTSMITAAANTASKVEGCSIALPL